MLEALGVEVDLDEWRMRLTSAKALRYAAQAAEVAGVQRCSRAVFEQLLGRLQFAAQCYPVGRQRLAACWRVARACFRLQGGDVAVSSTVQGELRWWAAELRGRREGVPLAAAGMPVAGEGSPAIYADASGSGGFMAWALVDGELLYVQDEWSAAERGLDIAVLELLASTVGLVALVPHVGRRVVSFSDSVVAAAAMRASAARSAPLQLLVGRRSEWAVQHGVVEAVARITSANNRWSDLGSRGQMARVEAEAAALGICARRIAIPGEWRDTSALCAAARDSPPPRL